MGEKERLRVGRMREGGKHAQKAIVVRFNDWLHHVGNHISDSVVARMLVQWYDSEAVRFFFFREKNPIHGVAETIPVGFLVLLTLVAPFLATVEFWLIEFGLYGVVAAMLLFVAIAWGTLEVMHYRYDRLK